MKRMFIVDRFEGDRAMVSFTWEDGTSSAETLPRKLLYPWTKEGDVLTIVLQTEEAETAWRRAQAGAAAPAEGG